MKTILVTILILTPLLAAGCYPVGHRYHDEDTHNDIMDNMNDVNAVDHR